MPVNILSFGSISGRKLLPPARPEYPKLNDNASRKCMALQYAIVNLRCKNQVFDRNYDDYSRTTPHLGRKVRLRYGRAGRHEGASWKGVAALPHMLRGLQNKIYKGTSPPFWPTISRSESWNHLDLCLHHDPYCDRPLSCRSGCDCFPSRVSTYFQPRRSNTNH